MDGTITHTVAPSLHLQVASPAFPLPSIHLLLFIMLRRAFCFSTPIAKCISVQAPRYVPRRSNQPLDFEILLNASEPGPV